MKFYIAGPMAGKENYNFPAFFQAEAALQAMGYETHNPARKESLPSLALPDLDKIPREVGGNLDASLGDVLREDFHRLMECDGVVLIDGWLDSVGAMAEALIAQMCGMPLYLLNWHGDRLRPFDMGRHVFRSVLVRK